MNKRKIILCLFFIGLVFLFTGCNSKEDAACAKGHTYNEWIVVKNPTCEEAGLETRICQVCDKKEDRAIPALGHSWDEGTLTKEATCNEDGVKTYTCTRCSKTQTEVIAKRNNHLWDTGVETKAASCIEEGIMTYTCTACKETKTEIIPKVNHVSVYVEGKSATCTENGIKNYYHCSICNKNYDGEGNEILSTIIEALGHDFHETDEFEECARCHLYHVNYYMNHGSNDEHIEDYYSTQKAYALNYCFTCPDDKLFVCWCSSSTGEGEKYYPNTEYDKIPNNLYAIYEDNTIYTIKFVDLNGNLIKEEGVKKGQMPTLPEEEFKKPILNVGYQYGWDKEVVAATCDTIYTAKFKEVTPKTVSEIITSSVDGDIVYVTGVVAGVGYKILKAGVLIKDLENNQLLTIVDIPEIGGNKAPTLVGLNKGDEVVIRVKVCIATDDKADKGAKYLQFVDLSTTNSDYIVASNVDTSYNLSAVNEITTQDQLKEFVAGDNKTNLDTIVKIKGTVYINYYDSCFRITLDSTPEQGAYQCFSSTTSSRLTYLFFRNTYASFNIGTSFQEAFTNLPENSTQQNGLWPAATFTGELYFIIMGADGYNHYATVLDASHMIYNTTYDYNFGDTPKATTLPYIVGTEYKLAKFNDLTWEAPTGMTFKEWNTEADGTGTTYLPDSDGQFMPKALYAIWDNVKKDIEVKFVDDDGTELSKKLYGLSDLVDIPEISAYKIKENKVCVFKCWDKEVVKVAEDTTYTATYDEYILADVSTIDKETTDVFFVKGIVLGSVFCVNMELVIKDQNTNDVISVNFSYSSSILGTTSSPKLNGFKRGDMVVFPVVKEYNKDTKDPDKVRLQYQNTLIEAFTPGDYVVSSNNSINFDYSKALTVSNQTEMTDLITIGEGQKGNSYSLVKLVGPFYSTYFTSSSATYKYETLLYRIYFGVKNDGDISVTGFDTLKSSNGGSLVQFRQIFTNLNLGSSFGELVFDIDPTATIPTTSLFGTNKLEFDGTLYCLYMGGGSYNELFLIGSDSIYNQVNYAANNSSEVVINKEYNKGNSFKLLSIDDLEIVAPTGTKFKEWNTAYDGSGESYQPGENLNTSVTLYAVWESLVKPYTVEFKDENGKILSTSNYGSGDNVDIPEIAKCKVVDNKLNVFSGWDKEVVAVVDSTIYTAVYDTLNYTIYDVKDVTSSLTSTILIRGIILSSIYTTNQELIIKDVTTDDFIGIYNVKVNGTNVIGTSSTPSLGEFKIGDLVYVPCTAEVVVKDDAVDNGKLRLKGSEIEKYTVYDMIESHDNPYQLDKSKAQTITTQEEFNSVFDNTTVDHRYTYLKLTGTFYAYYAGTKSYSSLYYYIYFDQTFASYNDIKNVCNAYPTFRQQTVLDSTTGELLFNQDPKMDVSSSKDRFVNDRLTFTGTLYCLYLGGSSTYNQLVIVSVDDIQK